jgi:predicted transcriptional regulator of viral defense system
MAKNTLYKIKDWIADQEKRGKTTFSRQEIVSHFPLLSEQTVKNNLNLLVRKKAIISIFNGFYSVIPVHYALSGIVPPDFYIDDLMKYLKRQYYVGLLNAAAFYGAAHQKPQQYAVITVMPSIRERTKKSARIRFISTRKEIPQSWLKLFRGENGNIQVSTPELTAVDLITFQKEIGGLNRSCTVLYELLEAIKFDKLDRAFFNYVPVSTIQRLGYLLENFLEQPKLAGVLHTKAQKSGCQFQKIPLKYNKPVENCKIDKKWKIIVNEQIEIDEI